MRLDCRVNALLPYIYFLSTPKIVKDIVLQIRAGILVRRIIAMLTAVPMSATMRG